MDVHEYFKQKKIRSLEELERDLTLKEIIDIIYPNTDANITILMKNGKIFFRYDGKVENKAILEVIRFLHKKYDLEPIVTVLNSDVDPSSELIRGGVVGISDIEALRKYVIRKPLTYVS